jgi:hypothetical protein
MNWKNFRSNTAINDLFSILGSMFIATWPAILTNWLSDALGTYLHINTPVGAWYVSAAAIASILMAFLFRNKRNPIDPYNFTPQSGSHAKSYLMQGGMFSLALALTQVCQGVYAGPLTDEKILPAVLALIPALEGTLGSQFIHIANNQVVYYVDTAIRELVANNTRVNERMIIEHARNLGMSNPPSPFDSITDKDIIKLVRSRMVHVGSTDELNNYLFSNQKIEMIFTNPKSWRFEKKLVHPKHSPSSDQADSAANAKVDETESQQRDAWERLKANIYDEEAYLELCKYTYHTDKGLSAGIKFEISRMINGILSSAIEEHRSPDWQEREKISILKNVLGELNSDKDQGS